MKSLVAVAMVTLAAIARADEHAPVAFALPGDAHLSVAVTIDGESPLVAWKSFLELYFAYFDLDGDGHWSKAEALRTLPMPSVVGKGTTSDNELSLDFEKLDANSDAAVTFAELETYFQQQGFTPVVGATRGDSSRDGQLGRLFRDALDADGDRNITPEELAGLARRLRKYDLNEDEYISLTELVVIPQSEDRRIARSADVAAVPVAKLQLEIGASKSVQLNARELPLGTGNGYLVALPQGNEFVFGTAARLVPNVKSSGEFLLAQLEGALGSSEAIEKTTAENDPTLGGLVDSFPFADRNGDAKLTASELRSWLSLIEVGLVAQVRVTMIDRGENLFPLIDSDADGRLSARELAQTPEVFASSRGALPHVFQLECGTPTPRTWGGVTIPTIKPAHAPRTGVAASLGWFRALDRNGDGVVSRREFVGPPKAFSLIDYNGDGLIQPEEAARHN